MANGTKDKLWEFIDDKASFRVSDPESVSRLYFPLCNEAGILSSITPALNGDIKTSHNSFLTLPVSAEDLHNTRSGRNFWLSVEGKGLLSLTGASPAQRAARMNGHAPERSTLEAGMLWHKVTRTHDSFGLRSEVVNFVPVGPDTVELMLVTVTNTSKARVKLTPTSAIPIFARSADNLRDHSHVTSLLHRIISHPSGVVVKPTMSFDERGHKINETLYAVLGATGSGETPLGSFYTVPDFIGEGGDLEAPRALLEDRPLPQKDGRDYQGKSAIGALRFKTATLAPGQKAQYVLLLGIADKESKLEEWLRKYGSAAKAEQALAENKAYWAEKVRSVSFHTRDRQLDGWLRWVTLQPTLRKIFGCSFLPDFDYGRGGRGWRDLWQDCLALILTAPSDAREILLSNFNGVRIDGSNATIIGSDGRTLIADRNNITRVWMDHGVWPFLTSELYIHQTGDFDILFRQAPYFKDRQLSRASKKDEDWNESLGKELRTKNGDKASGSVLEHLLVQHLVQFFNVGEHNHIRLENADWNDGLDMAHARGESVAFTTLYGSNFRRLALLLEELARRKAVKKIELSRELLMLLDRATGEKVDYDSADAKHRRLRTYFDAVQPTVSGAKTELRIERLIEDLRAKSEFISQHVQKKEWISTRAGESLFNGYYDDHGRRVEGDFPKGMHMTLAGQVFPVMSGIATPAQVAEIWKTAKKYLKDREHGGFRLNTDFHQIRPDLGRAFSFAYGEKENGAFFSHMAVMFANALYQRGFVNEGREVLDSIYRMCVRTDRSKIFPGIPEYFNSEGRGMYHYLTGSASWLILTMLTQVYGIRGHYGDLVLAPKLTQADFEGATELSAETTFAERRIKVIYRNPKKIMHAHCYVSKLTINGKEVKNVELGKQLALVPKASFLKNARKRLNVISVTLE